MGPAALYFRRDVVTVLGGTFWAPKRERDSGVLGTSPGHVSQFRVDGPGFRVVSNQP